MPSFKQITKTQSTPFTISHPLVVDRPILLLTIQPPTPPSCSSYRMTMSMTNCHLAAHPAPSTVRHVTATQHINILNWATSSTTSLTNIFQYQLLALQQIMELLEMLHKLISHLVNAIAITHPATHHY